MAPGTIIYEKDGHVGIVRLNRPERMNAVNEAMYREIQAVLNGAGPDDDIRVVIITGSVYRKDNRDKQAFCAGADLKEHAAGKRTRAQQREYIELAHETCRMLYEFPKPTIAAVNGPARGAGVEMALNCDFILMADDATIAFPELGLGTFVGGGVTAHLPAVVGAMKAKELIYTGRIIDGKEAVHLGIALRSFPVEALYANTLVLANELAKKAPLSLTLAKARLQDAKFFDLKSVLEHETEAILSCMASEDWQEGIRSFIEKREPLYKGK